MTASLNFRRLSESTAMRFLDALYAAVAFAAVATATPVLYDGRAPFNLTNADLNASIGPYLTWVLNPVWATYLALILIM